MMRAMALLAVAAVLSAAGIAGYALLNAAGPGSSQTTGSSLSTNSSSWAVIRSNTTLYYGPACVPLEVNSLSCPTMNTATHSPSLTNVDVISYKGMDLYAMNFTCICNGQPDTHTVFFTNTTIICVSPSAEGYPLCPTRPVEPVMVVTPSASSANPSNGLRLDLRLSNSSEGLNVTVDEHNTLNKVNNVTAANEWAIYSNSLKDICVNLVATFAIYQGDYGASNFTAASPLILDYPDQGSSCPEPSPSPSVVYSFNPDSGLASAPARTFPMSGTSINVNITLSDTISGYYTCGANAPSFRPDSAAGMWTCATRASIKFNLFPAGVYTVVALDQWGDIAVSHFEVQG